MSIELPPTAYVILGMIRLGKTNGYEIKQLVDVSTRRFWAASYGQIYPELKRLEEAGLIEGEDAPAGGRQRRSYRLTKAGKEALHEWLASDDELSFEVRDAGLLRFFFADAMSTGETVALLRRMRERHERIASELRVTRESAAEAPASFPYMTADFGVAHHQWIADWCAEKERELLEEGAADVHPPS
jgi:PadR family transcriptional regulator, regulatory protein AphA